MTTPKIALLDSSGDLALVGGRLLSFAPTFAQAVAIRLRNRILLVRGTWFLAASEGFPWRAILGQKPDIPTARALFRKAILECPGIVRVDSLTVSFQGATRVLDVTFSATCADGSTVSGFDPLLANGVPVLPPAPHRIVADAASIQVYGDSAATIVSTGPVISPATWTEAEVFGSPTVTVAPSFTLANLPLSGLWEPDFGGSPWVGNASAGASGGRNLTEATTPATPGTVINGQTPASFNGTNKKLTSAINLSSFLTTTEWSAGCVFKATAITGGSANGYDNPTLFCDLAGGNIGLHVGGASNDKALAYLYDSIVGAKKIEFTITPGAWNFIQFRAKASSGICEARLNGGTWTALSGPAFTSINGTLASLCAVGRDYSQTKFFNGDMGTLFFSQTSLLDADFDNARTYLSAQYAQSF